MTAKCHRANFYSPRLKILRINVHHHLEWMFLTVHPWGWVPQVSDENLTVTEVRSDQRPQDRRDAKLNVSEDHTMANIYDHTHRFSTAIRQVSIRVMQVPPSSQGKLGVSQQLLTGNSGLSRCPLYLQVSWGLASRCLKVSRGYPVAPFIFRKAGVSQVPHWFHSPLVPNCVFSKDFSYSPDTVPPILPRTCPDYFTG